MPRTSSTVKKEETIPQHSPVPFSHSLIAPPTQAKVLYFCRGAPILSPTGVQPFRFFGFSFCQNVEKMLRLWQS